MLRRLVLSCALAAMLAPALTFAADTKPVVLLAGATGKNGSVILKQLEGTPFTVRAMSRDIAKAKRTYGTQVEWVEADVTKPETLGAALKGVTYVIDAVAAQGKEGNDRPEIVDFEGTKNLVAAAKVAHVKRIVIITSSVSGKKDHILNKIDADVLIYKGKAEDELIASGIPYVIIGPAGMNNDPGSMKKVELVARKDYKEGSSITRADTAAVAIEALTNPAAANKAFSVSNSDAKADTAWKSSFAGLPAR